MKYTPGPWKVDKHNDNQETVIRGNEHGGHMIVANLEADNYWDEPEERIQANARLIAAAPQLLEALKMLKEQYMDIIPENGWDTFIIDKIDKAIDLAEPIA